MNAQPLVEIDLEEQIDRSVHELHTAQTKEAQHIAWERLKKLHAMRTPERVEEMERERGLR